jgi:hypothetical protein
MSSSSIKISTDFAVASVRVLGLLALVLTTLSCSPQKDPGANIALAVSPSRPFVVPGRGLSCIDLANLKANPTADLPGSVGANRILYSNFRLQWRSDEALTLTALRVKVKIPERQTSGRTIKKEQEISFDQDEIEALLGLDDATIPLNTTVGSEPRVVEINSNSTSQRDASSVYAACGLHVGGIEVGETTPDAYFAEVLIEVAGYATRSDGQQSPVRQSLTAQAEGF